MTEVTDEELEKLEDDLAKLEKEDSYGSPKPEKKDSTLVLFRELIGSKDSRKFGNLSATDLGKPEMSVRDHLERAAYLDVEGLEGLGNYFRQKSEIILSTSLSHKAKLIDNIVTQIKKEQKVKETPSFEKKRLFHRKPKEESE